MNPILRNSLLALGTLALTACSGTSAIQGVNVSTSNSNGSTQVTLTAQLNTGQITVPPVSYQFPQPSNSTQMFGSITVSSPSATETDVILTYDFPSSLLTTNLPTTTTLPNGTSIPITGPNSVWQVLSANLKSGSTANPLLYLNSSSSLEQTVIGYVLPLSGLNSGVIGNVMQNFNLSGISGSGLGGIFSGTGTGTSGFALFANLSSLFGSLANTEVQSVDLTPDAVKIQIQKHLYELNQNHAHLEFR
jgi:hypothetical protein